MSVQKSVVDRINSLITIGRPLSPAEKMDFAYTYVEEQSLSGWMTSCRHIIDIVFGPTVSAYTRQSITIQAKFDSASIRPEAAGSTKRECIGAMVSLLENLLTDIELGLISSVEDRVRAETFDDFLDHAEEYHKSGKKKESGVIVGVVFEDSIRKIAKNKQTERGRLEELINDLAKKGVLSATKAKRAKVAAHVRTKATHADWDGFDLKDVGETIRFTRELISEHLDI